VAQILNSLSKDLVHSLTGWEYILDALSNLATFENWYKMVFSGEDRSINLTNYLEGHQLIFEVHQFDNEPLFKISIPLTNYKTLVMVSERVKGYETYTELSLTLLSPRQSRH
jgi:hypothetical protein